MANWERRVSMKRLTWLTSLAAVCVLVAGCGSSSTSTTSKTVGGKVVIANETGSTWTCQFNPLNPADTSSSFGFVYEPLMFVNSLQSSKAPVPMLATSSEWSNNFRTLTFTIRKGATWSDGQPLTASDVAYTFNAMKSDKAIDLNAIWVADGGPLTNVALSGTEKVVFTFRAPSEQDFYFVADQTPIIPQHIWSTLKQSELHSYADGQPVGTGPYKVANCAPQNIKFTRNPSYWQSTSGNPVPKIAEVDYPAFLSNTPTNLYLAQGQAQWGGQYVPNIHSFYIAKDPEHRHYWFPAVANVSLFPNLSNPVLSQLPVRQALAYAIDKATVARLGESGYQQPAHQTGIITPTFESWQDSSLPETTYNTAKAQEILNVAGFTKGSEGIYRDKSGRPLSFTVKTISGFSDWDASLQLITQQLKAAGIAVTVQDENTAPYTTNLQNGSFQLAYAGSGGPAAISGPTPYYELRALLFGGNVGSTNYSRYKSESTDALFNQYAGANPEQQKELIKRVQKVMVNEVPFIPVTQGVDWYQYDTSHIEGWPTESNQYAQPSPYVFPDLGIVLAHLYPK
jgi:peptide/nickel transport system substrate-binding protein